MSMKTIGIFDAKTRLSEICEEVAETHEAVTITKRGKPLVRIDPVEAAVQTIRERREVYMAAHGATEGPAGSDFEPAVRSTEVSDFGIED